MNDDSAARLREIFDSAMEVSPEKRCEFLEEACRGKPELRAGVEAMLAAFNEADDFLDPPAFSQTSGEVVPPDSMIGKRIGQFTILRLIAAGGMGVVFEAEQERPRRPVAMKLMSSGIASRTALRRFEFESHLLARLQHPGIAQVYEAGTHDDPNSPGRTLPYFAMEYIRDAQRLTDYARDKKLSTRQRLEIFAKVCDAVHHGHQKGIVHRDLKPANILVDATGQPKIIDFGVARCTDSDLAVTTQTDLGQLVGTLRYMSPEQCMGDSGDIDTRSDVYSLGVVLFEFLSGRHPLGLERRTVPDAVRIIRDETPTRLGSVDKTLQGDLEHITFKAIEKVRARRYQSAAELAQDVRHYLEGEAIVARAPSAFYRMSVFARMNKGVCAATAGILLVLAIGMVVSSSLYVRAKKQTELALFAQAAESEQRTRAEMSASAARDAAEAAELETRKTAQVALFLSEMLKGVGPSVAKGRDTTMLREILEKAERRIGTDLKEQPEVEATLRETLGNSYRDLGDFQTAEKMLLEALHLNERHLHPEDPNLAGSICSVADLFVDQSRFELAEPLYLRALAIYRKSLGERHPKVGSLLNRLAELLWNLDRHAEGEQIARRALAILEESLGPDHPDVGDVLANLGLVRRFQFKYDEAEQFLRRAITIQETALGYDHPQLAATLNSLAELYRQQNEYALAEPLYLRSLSIRQQALSPEHPLLANTILNLGGFYDEQKKTDKAEPLLKRGLELCEKSYGPDHVAVATALYNLGLLYFHQGRFKESEQLLQRSVQTYEKILAPDHRSVMIAIEILGESRAGQGKFADAVPLYRRAYSYWRDTFGELNEEALAVLGKLCEATRAAEQFDDAIPILRAAIVALNDVSEDQHWWVNYFQLLLFDCLAHSGHLIEAESLWDELLAIKREHLPTDDVETGYILTELGVLLSARGERERAESMLREGLGIRRKKLPAGHVYIGYAEGLLGEHLTRVGQFDDAEPLLLSSHRIVQESSNTPSAYKRQSLERLVKLYTSWGKPDKASAFEPLTTSNTP